jgi:hypothetical protein
VVNFVSCKGTKQNTIPPPINSNPQFPIPLLAYLTTEGTEVIHRGKEENSVPTSLSSVVNFVSCKGTKLNTIPPPINSNPQFPIPLLAYLTTEGTEVYSQRKGG